MVSINRSTMCKHVLEESNIHSKQIFFQHVRSFQKSQIFTVKQYLFNFILENVAENYPKQKYSGYDDGWGQISKISYDWDPCSTLL